MNRSFCPLFVGVLVSVSLVAGVVYEIETKDHDASPPRTLDSTFSVEGRQLKFDGVLGSGPRSTVIYRGDRREMVVVDHDRKSYMVIDEQALQKVGDQLNQASRQIQEQLKNLPEAQRAMVEKMMKGRLPQTPERPTREVREAGENATKNGYPCVRYEVFRDGRKAQDLWITDWGNIPGGDEVHGVFQDMANFYRQLLSNSQFGGAVSENPFVGLEELEGFPVVTRSFEDNQLENESQLRSARRRTLDPAELEPPAGYKRRSMLPRN